MTVFVANEQTDAKIDSDRLVSLAQVAMEAEGVGESELSIMVVGVDVMTELNERFMGEQRPTDVLAFPIDGPVPLSGPPEGPTGPGSYGGGRAGEEFEEDDEEDADDEPWLLGDVVLCPAYAAKQAADAGQTLAAELEMLLVHGILHLCGLDHANPEEERVMKARTDELLGRWRTGLTQPPARPAGGS
jgi:probable rRNA maturation factor